MSQGDSDEKSKMESRPHFDSQEEPKMAHIVIKDSPRKPQSVKKELAHLCICALLSEIFGAIFLLWPMGVLN